MPRPEDLPQTPPQVTACRSSSAIRSGCHGTNGSAGKPASRIELLGLAEEQISIRTVRKTLVQDGRSHP